MHVPLPHGSIKLHAKALALLDSLHLLRITFQGHKIIFSVTTEPIHTQLVRGGRYRKTKQR